MTPTRAINPEYCVEWYNFKYFFERIVYEAQAIADKRSIISPIKLLEETDNPSGLDTIINITPANANTIPATFRIIRKESNPYRNCTQYYSRVCHQCKIHTNNEKYLVKQVSNEPDSYQFPKMLLFYRNFEPSPFCCDY